MPVSMPVTEHAALINVGGGGSIPIAGPGGRAWGQGLGAGPGGRQTLYIQGSQSHTDRTAPPPHTHTYPQTYTPATLLAIRIASNMRPNDAHRRLNTVVNTGCKDHAD